MRTFSFILLYPVYISTNKPFPGVPYIKLFLGNITSLFALYASRNLLSSKKVGASSHVGSQMSQYRSVEYCNERIGKAIEQYLTLTPSSLLHGQVSAIRSSWFVGWLVGCARAKPLSRSLIFAGNMCIIKWRPFTDDSP